MLELIITGLVAATPGLLAAGGAWVRLARVEKDVEARVSREVFDVHLRAVEKELAEIKALLISRYGRGHDDTNPGR